MNHDARCGLERDDLARAGLVSKTPAQRRSKRLPCGCVSILLSPRYQSPANPGELIEPTTAQLVLCTPANEAKA